MTALDYGASTHHTTPQLDQLLLLICGAPRLVMQAKRGGNGVVVLGVAVLAAAFFSIPFAAHYAKVRPSVLFRSLLRN